MKEFNMYLQFEAKFDLDLNSSSPHSTTSFASLNTTIYERRIISRKELPT